jgi:protein SCO1/2
MTRASGTRPALLLVAAVLAAVVGGGLWLRASLRLTTEPLQRYGRVPPFSLVDESGRPLGQEQLEGHPTVVAFFFTRCTTVCPRITADLVRLQQRLVDEKLSDQVELLSISVDPDQDTPEALAAYARQHGARPGLWHFVTGRAPDVERVVVDGFHQTLERRSDPSVAVPDILHGSRLILLDGASELRGFYTGKQLDALVDALRTLVTRAQEGDRS